MTQLTKQHLLRQIEKGLEKSGWKILHLCDLWEHPARYRITRDGSSFVFTAYIWNITHGGGPRSQAEYRIQVTGLHPRQFVPDPQGRTAILGYWDAEAVFAGFDHDFHAGPLGGSPSFQVGRKALEDAKQKGLAVHKKGTGELVIGFRREFVGTYVEHLKALHASGQKRDEVDLLSELSENPTDITREDIEARVQEPRRYAIVQTRQALRDIDFRDRVLRAYSHQCAICDMQLGLLDGAHIYPASEPASTDETANGVALCTLHHRAYDRGLVTFDASYSVVVHDLRLMELANAGQDKGAARFRRELSETVRLPPNDQDWPNPVYVERANRLRGWSL